MSERIVLVSCVKSKRRVASPAKDLYVSALFRKMRAFAEAHGDAWYILSAQHGLLDSEQVVAPYERTLNRMRKFERTEWSRVVRAQLREALPLRAEVVILAGTRHRESIEPFLRECGHPVQVPMRGLDFGNQLRWLGQSQRQTRA